MQYRIAIEIFLKFNEFIAASNEELSISKNILMNKRLRYWGIPPRLIDPTTLSKPTISSRPPATPRRPKI